MRFGQRLRELREAKGMSRKQLAESMELSERAVIQWELGEREPGWFNVLALCTALGVECTALTIEPKDAPAPERGRPRKTPAPEGKLKAPKRGKRK
ncbi:MAG: helix-turn-helix domain-containing protein [Gemmataceae bacterium]